MRGQAFLELGNGMSTDSTLAGEASIIRAELLFHSISSVIAFQLAFAIMKGILYHLLALLAGDCAPHVMVECHDSLALFADDEE